jgi:hypothetical protein
MGGGAWLLLLLLLLLWPFQSFPPPLYAVLSSTIYSLKENPGHALKKKNLVPR